MFYNCSSIVVETRSNAGRVDVSNSIWDYATQVIMYVARYKQGVVGSLGHLLVGNRVDGFCGIERELDEPFRKTEMGSLCWMYRSLASDECKQLIYETYSAVLGI